MLTKSWGFASGGGGGGGLIPPLLLALRVRLIRVRVCLVGDARVRDRSSGLVMVVGGMCEQLILWQGNEGPC